MTRHAPAYRLALAIFGVLVVLSLPACWNSYGEGMTEEADETAAAEDEKPRVTLYMTSWCGYCRKARRLLDSLEVPYEAKDIEESEEAAREYRKKAGSYRGIPVLDVDGRIVKGYQAELIHELVTRLKRQE
jgi:glutaredoxin